MDRRLNDFWLLQFESPGFQIDSLRSLAVFNLRAIGKRESRDKERQSREKAGREATEKPPARMAAIFC